MLDPAAPADLVCENTLRGHANSNMNEARHTLFFLRVLRTHTHIRICVCAPPGPCGGPCPWRVCRLIP